jgi:hypothetical protein
VSKFKEDRPTCRRSYVAWNPAGGQENAKKKNVPKDSHDYNTNTLHEEMYVKYAGTIDFYCSTYFNFFATARSIHHKRIYRIFIIVIISF